MRNRPRHRRNGPRSRRRAPGARPGPLPPHAGVIDRATRRRSLGHRLPQRDAPPAPGGPARPERPSPGAHDPHDLLGPARAPAARRARRPPLPPRVRAPAPEGHRQRAAGHAGPGLPARRCRAAARRLVRGRRGRPRAPRLGHRLPHGRRPRGARPDDPAAGRARRSAHAAGAPAVRPGVAHLRARPRGVGRGRRRAAHAARGVARLRDRAGPVHPAAAGWARGADLRDRDHDPLRAPLPRLHPRLRDDHAPGDGRRARRTARVGRHAERGDGPHRPRRADRRSRTTRPRWPASTSRRTRVTSWASARNRLVLYEHEGASWLRAAGTWDEMPFPLDQAYRRVGRDMQARFWGEGDAATSMLHQIATQSGETG